MMSRLVWTPADTYHNDVANNDFRDLTDINTSTAMNTNNDLKDLHMNKQID